MDTEQVLWIGAMFLVAVGAFIDGLRKEMRDQVRLDEKDAEIERLKQQIETIQPKALTHFVHQDGTVEDSAKTSEAGGEAYKPPTDHSLRRWTINF